MAMPASGTITFAELQTEFGGSHPITMGEYAAYRNAGSGNTISMTQFYGTSSADYSMTAVDISNISYSGVATSQFSNAVTVAGIDATVTLSFAVTVSSSSSPLRQIRIQKNSTQVHAPIVSGTYTIDVVATDTIRFQTYNGVNSSSLAGSITTTNSSDGGAAVDSFTFSHYNTNSGGGFGD